MVAKQVATNDVLARLFQTAPAEFVAERNRVAKELRAAGDKELAATVAAVRRPRLSDWALNVSAIEHAAEVGELVEAAGEVIDAQEAAMEGRDGGDLRVRLKLQRMCTGAVAALASGIAVRVGQTGSGSSNPDITTRLIEICANRDALRLLRRGLLGAEDPGSIDPFAGVGGALASEPAPRRRTSAPATKAKGAALSKSTKPDPGQPAGERKRRRETVVAAKKALATAESAAAAAQREVAKHESSLAKARDRVSDAEAQLEVRRRAVAAAADELESVRASRDAATTDVEAAAAALAAAERVLTP